ncbi:sugar phosphate nucleotidyltransferase [Bradyrhizobium sp. CB1650]|uniref:sugar phosphate nucleotidyltransferase n=1 Tax=Bradyrhizobium sp. CB1650 TaxID=3039153 RepID=UPI002434BB96|nr:sugar phosphate nucleotidyltransferase [Bradyrhizobium sp. CB1650]WGD55345.1 sugar phosphate nucleotidyltransferase [Bradyrhizobium sp. CB1650]
MRTAIVLAGGLGSRLKPYTVVLPKPLMPIGEMPILEVILRQLKLHHFSRVILAVNHQADILKAYFGDGARFGIDVSYSLETKRLGTMGPLRLIGHLPENFIVMNGDILCDLNFSDFFLTHENNDRLFTISAAERTHTVDYGVLERSGSGNLVGFREKPQASYLVSMGVYCASRAILDWIPQDESFGFDQLMLSLLAADKSVVVEPHQGYWLDIGRPDDYHQAIAEWPQLKSRLLRD